MHRFSYLITYRESDASRRNNLRYLLNQLARDSSLEIILVEQDVSPHFEVGDQTNLRYIFVENAGSFNKSWGLNIAAKHANCERLILADSDMLIDALALQEMSQLMAGDVDAINPYTALIDLDEHETQQLLSNASAVHIERSDALLNRKSIGQNPPFCGGVFAVTRALFEVCGGMDERFEGWGGEDDAISKRVAHFASNMISLDHQAYHLWHPPSAPRLEESHDYIRNLGLLTLYYERPQSFYQQVAQADSATNASEAKYVTAKLASSTLSQDSPLVSCLCVTRNRVNSLQRAIACFQAQSYLHTELLIVCESDDTATIQYIDQLNAANIRLHVVPVEPKLSLGALRNLSIGLAHGEFICQWDDDDWYHPERITKQLQVIYRQNKPASVLPRWLIHHRNNDKVYCSNVRLWEGSLLCRKSVLPTDGAYAIQRKGEDSKLIETLYIADHIAVEDAPELYVYCSSGDNTWDDKHFTNIIAASVELSEQDAASVKKRIDFSIQL
ncbi:glycosyltransferase [Arenicella xantha]|uniref:Glycosyl transferase family 2 n=1 Tax=Arenicella xantha TaxID=644221 RepID=A0A395JIN9_9GAMM|nr:glycosyltransferase [Arenicella xantha]RBP50646.1 glycosyl transferase family 2 [Arenicella xantha]